MKVTQLTYFTSLFIIFSSEYLKGSFEEPPYLDDQGNLFSLSSDTGLFKDSKFDSYPGFSLGKPGYTNK